MSDITSPHNPSGGTVVFLIDESQTLSAGVAGGTKSRAETLATALNSLLNQLAVVPDLEVALVGYRGAADGGGDKGGDDVGLRWSGPLEGRTFVSSQELADSPLRVEERVRRISGVAAGGRRTVRFPVWYDAQLGLPGSPTAAVEYCGSLLTELSAKTARPSRAVKPPLVLHFVAAVEDQRPTARIANIPPGGSTPQSVPLLLHAHLGLSDRIPATLYPSSDTHLAPAAARILFEASSILPEAFAAALRETKVNVNSGARGMIHNATMIDLIRFLALTKTYATYQGPVAHTQDADPPVETTVVMAASDATVSLSAGPAPQPSEDMADSPPSEPDRPSRRALLVLLMDGSIRAGQRDDPNNAWTRLQLEANRLLGQLAGAPTGGIDVALVFYGRNAAGDAEIRSAFDGSLAAGPIVADTELAARAIRVEQFVEQVSNGIGGLVSLTRKRPIFVDLPPREMAPSENVTDALEAAFQAAAGLIADGDRTPVVLHLTRGRFDAAILRNAVGGRVVLHHLIATETPHPSIAYPADANSLVDESLKTVWQISSPLVGGAKLAADKSTVTPESRGMVVNGRFDLLLDGLKHLLAEPP